MIDEEKLGRLLRQSVDSIEVPRDGPEAVLAARDRLARPTRPAARPTRPAARPTRPAARPTRRWLAGRWWLAGPAAGGDREPLRPRRIVALGFAAAAIVVAVVVALGMLATPGRHSGPTAVRAGGLVQSSGVATGAASAAGSASPAGHGAAAGPAHSPARTAPRSFGGANQPATDVTPAPPSASSTSSAASSAASGTTAAGATSAGSAVASVPAKVIDTGDVDLRVGRGDLDGTMSRLEALATGLGGYVQTSKSTETGSAPSGEVTLEVPVAQFQALVTQVQALGHAVSVTTSGQDVTSQYAGLNAEIQSLQASRSQYLQVLAKAQSVSDILAVEQQITPLDSQIQQLQAQLKVLNGETSYGTLSVAVSAAPTHKAKVVPTPSRLSRAWQHARRSFTHGLDSVVSASGGIAVFLLCALVVVLALRLAWRVAQRRLL